MVVYHEINAEVRRVAPISDHFVFNVAVYRIVSFSSFGKTHTLFRKKAFPYPKCWYI